MSATTQEGMMRPTNPSASHLSLAGQHLVFQLGLLAVVLVAVTAISLTQTRSVFDSEQQRRMLTVAEYAAATPLLRSQLAAASGAPGSPEFLSMATSVEALRTTSGVDALLVVNPAADVVASPADPSLIGTNLDSLKRPRSEGGWSGMGSLSGDAYVLARVPVLDEGGTVIGAVIAGRLSPSLPSLLASAAPDLLTYLGVAGVLGAAGAWWLAARVKRQTLGLEPDEIGRLVEHREAMLHGIREGVISVDRDGTITLANDGAITLLGLPQDVVGRPVTEVGLEPDIAAALGSRGVGEPDTAVIMGGVVLVLSQTTIRPPRAKAETVTTIRDRTELVALQQDLGTSLQATDTLRAQTHEFANRLHTISMLLQLGDAPAAVEYIDTVSHDRSELDTSVLTRIAEPSVAALIIAKTSLARERDASLTLTAQSGLGRVDARLAADLVTVVGNLVDNALDAVTGAPIRRVSIEILDRQGAGSKSGPSEVASDEVWVTVADTGPGVSDELIDRVFEAGVTTKVGGVRDTAGHGFGLAIVQLVANRRHGRVLYRNEGGAVFTAVLPAGELSRV